MLEQPVKFNLQQERDFGEKLNGSFTFVSQNFKPLLLLLIKGAVPLAIIAGIAQGVYTSGLFSAMDTIRNSNEITDVGVFSLNWLSTVFAPVYLLSILFIFMTMVMTQCIVYGYMKIYNEKSGSVISETEVFEIVKRKFIIVLLADFVVAFITILAMVFLLIPGIYLGVVFIFVVPLVVIENHSLGSALSRCFVLIKDKWWSTLGLVFVATIISYMMSMIFALPTFAITMARSLQLIKGELLWTHILAGVIATTGQYVLYSFVSVVIGIQYYNLHERIEGKGLRAMIDSIGAEKRQSDLNTGDF